MKKFNFALALAVALGMSSAAFAEFGYVVGAATVDNVTTTACTSGDMQTVTGIGNGVSMDQVWALEREVGSPGSGAWETIAGFTDVFPDANGAAAVGGISQYMRYISEKQNCYRLHMTTDGGGTAQIQLITNRDAPTAWADDDRTHYRHFDDFQHGTVPITTTHNGDTPSYIVHIGAGSGAVLSVIEGEPEGTLTFSSGSAGDDTDLSTGSFGLLTNGALISSGRTAVEFRVAMSQITDARLGFGLVDAISAATEIEPFEANTNVVAEGAVTTTANAVAMGFDTDSNDAQGDFWLAYSINANTQGNAADEYSLGAGGVAPVAATYAVLRIEVDAAGHAFYFLNGLLVGAEPLAVATTAVLIPYWWAGSADDATGTVNKLHIDYIDFWAVRPGTVS
jgi:hypothetical protein